MNEIPVAPAGEVTARFAAAGGGNGRSRDVPRVPPPGVRSRARASRAVVGRARPVEVEIRCFGRFEVRRNGKLIEHWRRRSAERILKFLLVNRHPVHRDVLLDFLWPDAPAESSVRRLRVTLHALRRALACGKRGPDSVDLVRSDGDTYVLETSGVWIDFIAFSQHYFEGLRLEREQEPEAAIRELAFAEGVYRGDFLADDLYEEWTVLRREELKDQFLQVLTKLSDFCLQKTDLDGCIRRSHALLAEEPCREDAYVRLMRCYEILGHRGRAIRWYEICEQTLRKELDVAPSPETRRLYQRLLAGTVT